MHNKPLKCRSCGKEFGDRGIGSIRRIGSLCINCFREKGRKRSEIVNVTLEISKELRKEYDRHAQSSAIAMLDIHEDFFYADPEKLTDEFITEIIYKEKA